MPSTFDSGNTMIIYGYQIASNRKKGREIMKERLFIINNTLYIQDFILKIYSGDDLSTNKIDTMKLPIENLEYNFKTRSNHELKKKYQIIDYNGKIASYPRFTIKEGKLELNSIDSDNNAIIIKLNFETTHDKSQSDSFTKFFTEIQEIFLKYQSFSQQDKDQPLLRHFLRPHFSGLYSDLQRLNEVIEISYERLEDKIRIFGISEKNLLEYALHNQIIDDDNIVLKVEVNGNPFKIQWNEESEVWKINPSESQGFPQKGKFRVGENQENVFNRNQIHNDNKLTRMIKCLQDFSENINSKGRKNLIAYLNFHQKQPKHLLNSETLSIKDYKKIFNNNGLKSEYSKLNTQQKEVFSKFCNNMILIINGEGGTGKTEVAALLSIAYALLGNNILISSAKNTAIDNILKRIDTLLSKSCHKNSPLNILRIRSKYRDFDIPKLNKYELSKEIEKNQVQIEQACSTMSKDKKLNDLKKKFRQLLTKSEILERLFALTYDIILTTYGILSERKYLADSIQEYALNICEAGSSISFSEFSLSAINSKKWIILNDNNQILPMIVGDFLLKQPLKFHNKNEIQNAIKYNPNNQHLRGAKILSGIKEYRQGVSSFFVTPKESVLSIIELKEQFRIHPALFQVLCSVFKKDFNHHNPNPNSTDYPDFSSISYLFSKQTHLNYIIMSPQEILDRLGLQIADLVEKFDKSHNYNQDKISIGIACTDVYSLRKIITKYKEKRCGARISSFQSQNYYHDNTNNLDIFFSSIENHQEREYDIFFLGIIKITSKQFQKRIYTALTRTHNYIIIYGPQIRNNIHNYNYLNNNKQLLQSLQRYSK